MGFPDPLIRDPFFIEKTSDQFPLDMKPVEYGKIREAAGGLPVALGPHGLHRNPTHFRFDKSHHLAGPRQCPIDDLIEVTGILAARSPKTCLTALVSMGSLAGVAVPWALMKSTEDSVIPARRMARRMDKTAP